MKVAILLFFGLLMVHLKLSESGGGEGNFYIENEGIEPKEIENDVISIKAGLMRIGCGAYPNDKRIWANVTLHRLLDKVAAEIEVYREDSKQWKKDLALIKVPTVCATVFDHRPFTENFSGQIDLERCLLDSGLYRLSNWSVEDHMKRKWTKFYFGHFRYHIKLYDKYDLLEPFVQFNMTVWSKSAKLREKKKKKN